MTLHRICNLRHEIEARVVCGSGEHVADSCDFVAAPASIVLEGVLGRAAARGWVAGWVEWAWRDVPQAGAIIYLAVELRQISDDPGSRTDIGLEVVVRSGVCERGLSFFAVSAARWATCVLDGEHLDARLHAVAKLSTDPIYGIVVDELIKLGSLSTPAQLSGVQVSVWSTGGPLERRAARCWRKRRRARGWHRRLVRQWEGAGRGRQRRG